MLQDLYLHAHSLIEESEYICSPTSDLRFIVFPFSCLISVSDVTWAKSTSLYLLPKPDFRILVNTNAQLLGPNLRSSLTLPVNPSTILDGSTWTVCFLPITSQPDYCCLWKPSRFPCNLSFTHQLDWQSTPGSFFLLPSFKGLHMIWPWVRALISFLTIFPSLWVQAYRTPCCSSNSSGALSSQGSGRTIL